jgi:hypothetical protein
VRSITILGGGVEGRTERKKYIGVVEGIIK